MGVHKTVLDSGLVDLMRVGAPTPSDVFPHLPPDIVVGDGEATFKFTFPVIDGGNPPTRLWVAIFAPGSTVPADPDEVIAGAKVVGVGIPSVSPDVVVSTVTMFAPGETLIKDAIYVPVIEHADVV